MKNARPLLIGLGVVASLALVAMAAYFTIVLVLGQLDKLADYRELPRQSVSLNVTVRHARYISDLTVAVTVAVPLFEGSRHSMSEFDDLPLGQHQLTYIFLDELHVVDFEIVREGGFLTIINGLIFDDPSGSTKILNTTGLVFESRARWDEHFLSQVEQ